MADPISDMFTRIRNAQSSGKEEALMPFSNLKMTIAKILQENDYIQEAKKETEGNISRIRIVLKYNKISAHRRAPAIEGIKRISKEGKRVYVNKGNIKKVKQGYGMSIVSTSRGVMTGEEAKKAGVGGELLCEVW